MFRKFLISAAIYVQNNESGFVPGKAVIKALREGSFDTVIGKIGFDEKGDVTGIKTGKGEIGSVSSWM